MAQTDATEFDFLVHTSTVQKFVADVKLCSTLLTESYTRFF